MFHPQLGGMNDFRKTPNKTRAQFRKIFGGNP